MPSSVAARRISAPPPRVIALRRTFEGDEFEATYAAERWLKERGYSVGRIQGRDPRGVMMGTDWSIAKWRNLNPRERAELHGVVIGAPRSGPVTILIYEGGLTDAARCAEADAAVTALETQSTTEARQ